MEMTYNVSGELLWSAVRRLNEEGGPLNKVLAHKLQLLIEEQQLTVPLHPSPPLSPEELELKQQLLEETRLWYFDRSRKQGALPEELSV